MTVRSDITFSWELSPRIIMVLAPSIELTIQDLVDTCRAEEDELPSMDDDHLINAAGKEPLGGGVTVGITATLQNAKVGFQARNTAASSGTVTTADSGTKLKDSAATFISDGIESGDTIFNITDQSVTTIITVDSEIQLTHEQLVDGSENDWDFGEEYKVFNVVQCELSGGNLVAIDDNGDPIDSIHPTAFTQIVRTSSSSATLQELSSIQFSSFNGGVTLDIINGTSGVTFPTGTLEQPVNNLTDAKAIANSRGFDRLFIIGNITFGSTVDIDGFTIEGQNPRKTTITLQTGVSTLGCEFTNATINGVLDGNSWVSQCTVQDLTYIEGQIRECVLTGTITLSGSTVTNIINCWDGLPGDVYPVIDFGGSGQPLTIGAYAGDLVLANKTGSDKASIDLISGQVIVNSSVIDGDIYVRGVGTLTDNSGGTAVIHNEALISQQLISAAVWDQTEDLKFRIESLKDRQGAFGKTIYWDYTNGNDSNSGLTSDLPVLTWSQAHTIATDHGNDVIVIVSTTASPIITEAVVFTKNDVHLRGGGSHTANFQVAGNAITFNNVHNCSVEGIGITSAVTGIYSTAGCVNIVCSNMVLSSTNIGVRISGTVDVVLNNITVGNSATSHIVIDNSSATIRIEDCLLFSAGSHGIDIQSGQNIMMTGRNTIGLNAGYGINIYSGVAAMGIQDGTFMDGNVLGNINDQGVWIFRQDATVELLRKVTSNKVTKAGDSDIITIYEDNGSTIWRQYDLASGGRVLV